MNEIHISNKMKLYIWLTENGLQCSYQEFSKQMTDYIVKYNAILNKKGIKLWRKTH